MEYPTGTCNLVGESRGCYAGWQGELILHVHVVGWCIAGCCGVLRCLPSTAAIPMNDKAFLPTYPRLYQPIPVNSSFTDQLILQSTFYSAVFPLMLTIMPLRLNQPPYIILQPGMERRDREKARDRVREI